MRPFPVLGAFAGALVLACTSSTEPRPETFSATLTTAAEVDPPVTNAPNASGSAAFTLRGATMDVTIDVAGLTGPAIGAHIHGPAAVGVNAPIIVSFDAQLTAGVTAGRLVSASFTSATAAGVSLDSVLVLMRNGNAYVNVHTALNLGGEIRGQIQQP